MRGAAYLSASDETGTRSIDPIAETTRRHWRVFFRKQFTVTERLAIAQRIAERLQGRVGTNQHVKKEGQEIFPDAQGQRTDLATSGNISPSDDAGRTEVEIFPPRKITERHAT